MIVGSVDEPFGMAMNEYCEVCKPGMIVVANTFSADIDDPMNAFGRIIFKPAPCKCLSREAA